MTHKKKAGPRTATGKIRSSRNSQTHGLYAAELAISKSDMPDFANLRCELEGALKPRTALKRLVFADLLACAWRMKLALRCEQVALQNLSAMSTAATTTGVESPYANASCTLRDRRKLIGELRERISNGEVISKSPELESQVTAVLGEYVLKMLASWTTKGRAAWAIAQVMVSKRENFGIDSPELRELEREGATLVAPDVYQLVISMLLDYVDHNLGRDVGVGENGTNSDKLQRVRLFQRYHTKARRDFYHALGAYNALK